MEIVDIVNNQNEVIGTIEKGEAHKTGALHRCIIAELHDLKGNWILVKQASDRQDAGQYVSPVGGHIQSCETEEDALKRETFEEVGIQSYQSKRIGQAIYNREVIGRKENHYFILYEIFSDHIPVLNHESVSFRKFSQEELKTELKENPKIFGDAFFFVLKTFYSHLLTP
jgi:isopentenyl-diphosphate Delta-isomerase